MKPKLLLNMSTFFGGGLVESGEDRGGIFMAHAKERGSKECNKLRRVSVSS